MANRTARNTITIFDVTDGMNGTSVSMVPSDEGAVLTDEGSGATTTITDGSNGTSVTATGSNGSVVITDGASGNQYTIVDGDNGSDGFNTANAFIYRRADSQPTTFPSHTYTYTFSTASGVFSNNSTSNGWSTTIPTGTDTLWTRTRHIASQGNTQTIATNAWSNAVALGAEGADGTDGLNAATITLYRRTNSTTAPSRPTNNVTYTFDSGSLSNPNNSWSASAPTNDNTYLWVTSASAISRQATDIINSSEWSTPQIQSANGTNGTDGTDGENGVSAPRSTQRVIYRGPLENQPAIPDATSINFNSGVINGLTAGWSLQPPGITGLGGSLYWTSTLTFSETSIGSSQNVSGTSPVQMLHITANSISAEQLVISQGTDAIYSSNPTASFSGTARSNAEGMYFNSVHNRIEIWDSGTLVTVLGGLDYLP